jgi:hypothetical protein
MQYQNRHEVESALFHLAGILEETAAGCDPEFDTAYDDLEREFAELRCQLAQS